MTFGADVDADLREILGDQSNAFRVALAWDSQTVYVNQSPPRETLVVEDGAEYTARVVDALVVLADLTGGTLPAKRKTVLLAGVKHFVHETQTDEAGISAIITLRRES